MNQEVSIVEELNTYINQTGIKAKFISQALGIPECVFSRYRHGKISLYKSDEDALREYLKDK